MPQGYCPFCKEDKEVHGKFGFAICDDCYNKKVKARKNTNPKNITKKEKKKAKKALKESEATATIYVVGKPADVKKRGMVLELKAEKYKIRNEITEKRLEKLRSKIERLQKRIESREERRKRVLSKLGVYEFLELKILKNKKIQLVGKTRDGGYRAKLQDNKWYTVPPNLIGEKQKLVEIQRVKEKHFKRIKNA